MIKVKDGYGKLIGTIYQGDPNYLLKADGGAWAVHTDRNDDPNKIVRTDASGYLQTGWINTTSGNMGTGTVTRIYCSNDGYIRYKTPANFFSTLSNNGDNISITVASQNRTLVVGYSKVAGQLRSKGTISPQTGRTQSLGDVYSYHLNSSVSGGPTTYASVIGFGRGTSGTVEIAGEWTSGRGLWVRALRDTTDNWYAWDKVLTQATYTGITDSRYYTKTQADERFVNITGDIMTGELVNSSANAYRLKQSNYGVILRNDNNSFWILLTNSGSPSGSYNSLRPFRINLPDGRVTIGNGLSVTGTIVGSSTIQGTQLISTIANGTAPLKVTSRTVVTNLNSDLLDGYHETSFFRARGSQTISGSIPTTTELSSNNNLSGNWNVKFPGASGHLVQFNTGSGSTRYMQFYSYYRGSLYWRNSTDSILSTKSWKTIVDSANYTGIVLKIGTATKGSATLPIYLNAGTPTACSTTLGVSITGNAATATKLQTARTINGTSFNGTTNITTAYWGATRTITLSGAVTGSASINGSKNVTITTTYQTGSIDGRYVGGKKTAGHGSKGTAYTADTYSSNFVNKAFVAYAERGSWSYANNGYITTNTGVNIPLAGTAIFQWGASDTNKTQLFITPHNNSGVSNPAANEMLFYTSNGSGYTSAWTRVLTHRNYTTYTVTKTGGGASGTWRISITGNAATATTAQYLASNSRMDYGWNGLNYFNINGTAGTAVKANNTPTTAWWHILRFNHANSSGYYTDLAVPFNANSLYYKRVAAGALVNGKWVRILDELNYTAYVNPANFVTSLGTNGNYVTWTKNGTTNNLTVPFATTSNVLNNLGNRTAISGTTVGQSGLRLYKVYNNGYPVTYGNVLNIGGSGYGELLFQWTGDSNPGHLYYRSKRDTASQAWSNWVTILDNNNYSSTLDRRYVTLTTNQTVSGIKTFSKQQKFTVATGTSPFTVSSTTVVSNLNADLLDGFHANTSQNPFGKIPTISSAGVMEVGRYLDFHYNSSDTSDYRTRLQINHSSGSYTAILPAKSGTLAMTSDIPTVTNYYWANVRVRSSSSTSTSPTFSTAYTSDWFRSTGNTGWYNQTHGGGIYMTDSTYVKVYNTKRFQSTGGYEVYYQASSWISMATRTNCIVASQNNHSSSAHALFRVKDSSGDAVAFGGLGTSIGFYGFYASRISNGTNGTDWSTYWNASNGTLYHTKNMIVSGYVKASSGFYHNSVNSNSYVLLAGGSYKSLSDFAKGNAGSTYFPVYVTGGTVKKSSYSFLGTSSQPVVLWAGDISRSSYSTTYWSYSGKGVTVSSSSMSASSNGGFVKLTFSGYTLVAACGSVRNFYHPSYGYIHMGQAAQLNGRSVGLGSIQCACVGSNVYIRLFVMQNKSNDSWSGNGLMLTDKDNGNCPITKIQIIVFGYKTNY